MKRKRSYLPKSFEELQKLNKDTFEALWVRYFDIPKKHMKSSMLRPLWYKIQCENMNLQLPQKIITKLNRYSKEPEVRLIKAYKAKYSLAVGTELIKDYKGKEYKVKVIAESDFLFNDKSYKTLSAVAKEICGVKVSGPDFFGLRNKKVNYGN